MTIPSISVKSPLHADHLALDAEFTARGIGSAVAYYGEQHAEQFNEQLSILDLSCINRIGFKGVQTCTWLEQQGVTLPQTPNSATVLPAGQIMLRLSSTEHWFWIQSPRIRTFAVNYETRTTDRTSRAIY